MDVIDTLCGFNREQLLEILSLHIQTATFPVRHAGPQKEPGAKTKKWWGGPVGKVLRYGQSLDHASVIHFLKKEWKGRHINPEDRRPNDQQRAWREWCSFLAYLAKNHGGYQKVGLTPPPADMDAVTGETTSSSIMEEFGITDGVMEGTARFRVHKERERNDGIVLQKKALAFEQQETVPCEICGFDFKDRYGDVGERYIECHHIVPLSESDDGRPTTLNDLILVCANCHRMLHYGTPIPSIQELKEIVAISIRAFFCSLK